MPQPLGLRIYGARQNNLKNISLEIPHDRLTVVTGVSGSGKSSLAFDTLFAEGQWRYIESLSTYARMFLDRVDRPDVDKIEQIRPAVALEQKNPVRTARSTVGTATEVYDYLRLLYAKIGRVHCPSCGAPAVSHSPESIVNVLLGEHTGARALITFRLAVPAGLPPAELWATLTRRGFARVRIDGDILDLAAPPPADFGDRTAIAVVLDRVVLDPAQRGRISESVESALREGGGQLAVDIVNGPTRVFAEDFRCSGCGAALERPQPLLFSFNHPLGACPECKGFGNVLKYDEARVVPDRTLSLADGAVEPWTHPSGRWYQRELMKAARRKRLDTDTPWEKLPEATRAFVYKGDGTFPGIQGFFEEVESYRYKLHVRVFLSRYRSQSICPTCRGARLKPAALAVRVGGLTIAEFTALTIDAAARLVGDLGLTAWDAVVAREILRQLTAKLTFLLRVGLGYLTLSRQTRTLSGGEAQRINLANQLGSQLVGTLYVLDEPSIGLHPRDTTRLADLCRELAQAGNTVVVVEHDREFIAAADHIVELGPGSGERGGEIVFNGTQAEFQKATHSLTARYVTGRESIPVPPFRRGGRRQLTLVGAREHNLKDVTLRVPLHTLTVVSGVSGSGKSTLVHDTLYRAVARAFKTDFAPPGAYKALTGIEYLKGVRLIDQEPIGRTPRSNPITYVKAFDEIRKLFAAHPRAKALGLDSGAFSFNVPGGRCESCQGDGFQKLEMYFFEDVYVACPECEGRRYRTDVLGVRLRGRSVSDVLQMTVDEAVDFFAAQTGLARRLQTLQSVGLGYLRLGQAATTLSGGEAQRLKIAAELGARATSEMLYVLDEPTTGLHLDDVKKLLGVLNRLVDAGNTVLVVEHHLDVIKAADHVIDLGPEGGEDGGEIVAEGPPETIAQTPGSYTGKFLAEVLPKPLTGTRAMASATKETR
ncbi:MAG: excinuclease ABC subunit A [Candidatus Rokuibacteriota bacterium]|nr:MAG: excinuclease ABC subunit A [Candidatus Rokubacteria bacterium]